ncbi:MAG TPA: sigma-54 dependent transcriptional regulator [Terriglobales bacterium]|nr:sigma-54 dependent transcriptional regulator [Terriglobales bacterium]
MIGLTTIPNLSPSGGALIASPSSALRERVLHRLNGRCRPVQEAVGGAEALVTLEKGDCQVLFLDRRLPDLDTDELVAVIERRFPGTQVVLLDSDNSEAAEGYGLQVDEESRPYLGIHPVEDLREPISESPTRARVEPLPGMIGTSEAMGRVYRLVRLVAQRPTTVLVAGPTGTGKELVARALHQLSPRAAKPFAVVNCAAIPETLLESELFGYSRGAFTGAVQAQMGRIHAAHGGTLFLDEVSELPLNMQAKLLRFLEQKEIQRLGSADVVRVDVRVIAASNVDLVRRAGQGTFREDLFFRLSAFPIVLPPLAERRADILVLAEHFLACMAAAMNAPCPRLSPEAARILEDNPWKGNVRELQHVMERASILVENGDTVLAEHLSFSYFYNPATPVALPY